MVLILIEISSCWAERIGEIRDSISVIEERIEVPDQKEIMRSVNTEELMDSNESFIKLSQNSIKFERERDYKFKVQQLILPGALLSIGIVGIWGYSSIQHHIHSNWSVAKGYKRLTIDNYLQYAPVPFYLGLGFIPGINHRSDWKEQLLAGVSAYAVMAILTNSMKYSFRVKRPDSSARNSFPSGHTATVFTGAELMRIEYGNWVGLGAYFIATGVSVLRIYNDRHWLSDVLGGAGIGILSARIGYWLVPWERKLFKLDKAKNNQNVVVIPTLGASNGLTLLLDL